MRSIEFFYQLVKDDLTGLFGLPVWISSLFVASMICAGCANALYWSIRRESIVGKPIEDVPIRRIIQMQNVLNEYEQRFPTGKKLLWFKLSFIAAGWLLGFFVLSAFWHRVI